MFQFIKRNSCKKENNSLIAVSDKVSVVPHETVIVNLLLALYRNQDRLATEKMGYVGGNTGNLIFTEAVKEQIHYQKEIWLNPTALKSVKNPSIIIPSANFLIPGNQDSLATSIIRFLENTDCPVTLDGLGAQSTEILNTPKKLIRHLSDTKIRCFKMLSERAVSLGIRGEFTGECLDLMGIHNYRIIGCPSAYKYLNEDYPEIALPTLDAVQVTVTPSNRQETQIFQMGHSLNAKWMMQMSTEFIGHMSENEITSALIHKVLPGTELSAFEIQKYVLQNANVCWSIEEWNSFYAENKITFAFGSRFHGNMAAFRNGIPALWITHDSRTQELVETLHLPHISRKYFINKIKYPEQLLEKCDYNLFYKKYPELKNNYLAFLKENHISVNKLNHI